MPNDEVTKGPTATRVQMELPNKAYDRLQRMRERTEAASYAEVMKNALRLYENIIEKHEQGFKLYMKDEAGQMILYEVF